MMNWSYRAHTLMLETMLESKIEKKIVKTTKTGNWIVRLVRHLCRVRKAIA